ncbi:LysM domain-containing protein [Nannizzia gypsea CBS 118893]|uniref:LysM domain-containing protein n=1 Tax=Arthroderma gypseum (strain ATCC MYA-4604 / CBS 118893) TaxID=535722 RepID=E4V1K4_ARTGP|nr:LysM domain-containing protein [Nannizzia gypsea CBS 118893]EFR03919.1 LysM domain-containing protein [Nannizzia gypsea CBS 118893]
MALQGLLLLLAGTELVLGGVIAHRGITPVNPHDDKATSFCSWWLDYNEQTPCDQILQTNSITLEQFQRWNPSITGSCNGLTVGRSYCVEAAFEPSPTASPTPTVSQTTSTTAPTRTPGAIETPQPTQPQIADNCNAFYLVKSGDSCAAIAAAHQITSALFLAWNPSVGNDCSGLWADSYACVSIVGYQAPTSSAPQPTPTKPSNGIETPVPTQGRMVDNCEKFHLVQSGEGCSAIASKYGITVAEFVRWNPSAGSDCSGLWANAYACVSVIGWKPTPTPPTTTKPSNGIQTPTPTQPDIVGNCNKFYLTKPGDSCASIASQNGIQLADFLKWNPKAGNNCAGLWANANACVSVIGYTPTPTPTKPGNGIQTPTPIQNGMVTNCKQFHFVEPGQTCSVIQAKYKVSLADVVKWNPAITANCSGMWSKAYLCVGTL